MPPRLCLDCGTPTRHGSRCAPCRSTRYGPTHQAERAAWAPLVDLGAVPCGRCGQPITPGTPWDLDHLPDTPTRPSHQACNRGAANAHRHQPP